MKHLPSAALALTLATSVLNSCKADISGHTETVYMPSAPAVQLISDTSAKGSFVQKSNRYDNPTVKPAKGMAKAAATEGATLVKASSQDYVLNATVGQPLVPLTEQIQKDRETADYSLIDVMPSSYPRIWLA